MTDKLKRCPFCGSKAVNIQNETFGYWARAVCDHCGASSSWAQADGYQDTESAIRLWNTRAGDKVKRVRRNKK